MSLYSITGQILADPPAPGCQPGVNVTFFDLTQTQAKYLSTQFPFLHGPGELLDTLRISDSKTVSQINFAPDSAKDLGKVLLTLRNTECMRNIRKGDLIHLGKLKTSSVGLKFYQRCSSRLHRRQGYYS